MKLFRKAAVFLGSSKGQTMAEYALLLASVAIIVFASYQKVGTSITGVLSSVDSKL
jgi:Flp pilus assembly pilin Flp